MTNKSLPVLLIFLGVCGCAAPGLYKWGNYEESLFAVYHEPGHKEHALKDYLAFMTEGGGPSRPIAPGLYAEAGTFLLEQGDTQGAIRYYRLEHEAWPESRPMMSVLIDNLEEK